MSAASGQSPDLSRIVSLIMQNPDLIHQIENLAKQDANTKEEDTMDTKAPIPEAAESTQAAAVAQSTGSREKRMRLLSALRPYVSEKRSKTLDTLIGAMDIFDLIGRG
jgi:hypothetical protein